MEHSEDEVRLSWQHPATMQNVLVLILTAVGNHQRVLILNVSQAWVAEPFLYQIISVK